MDWHVTQSSSSSPITVAVVAATILHCAAIRERCLKEEFESPALIRYPRRVPAGTSTDELLTSLEIVPTLLKEIGLQCPSDLILDGHDMMPVLTDGQASPRNEMFWQRRDDKAARVGNWKWVQSAAGNGLFDLSEDVGERHDLSASHPEKLADMERHFARWQATMQAAEPRGPFRDY